MTTTTEKTGDAAGRLAWGILGTGAIARRLAEALKVSKTGRLLAVGSRSDESANRFGDTHGIPRRYASYDALLSDPDVEAVYIALPNHLHALWATRCAEAGKHILCEKPLATNYGEAMALVEAARHHDVFLMEAFMYRCHPQTAKLADLVREGVIGDVRLIQAHFCFNMGAQPANIRQQNAAAGGGIMDVGCYCASMARLIAGAARGVGPVEPIEAKACAYVDTETRVDHWSTAVFKFPGDIVANLSCGIGVRVDSALRIWGAKGNIVVPNPWFPGDREAKIVVSRDGQKEPEIVSVEAGTPLYTIEADTVARHIRDRQAPYPCMSWEDSLGNMRVLDRWRKEIGLVFDGEMPEALSLPFSGRPLARRPDASMKYGRVEGIDKPVSRLVMGTMIYREDDMPLACAILDNFVEIGGSCLDTAYVYRTEGAVGRWLRPRGIREQLVLIGKGAHTPQCYPEAVTRQLAETLERLQTDYLDIYLLHRDNLDIPVGEFVDCLDEHRRAGRIRAFGGSNWTTQRIQAANEYARAHDRAGFVASSPNLALAVWNAPMYAGGVTASDAESRAWYARTQLPLFAWTSQASGFFTGRYGPENRDDPAAASVVKTWFGEANFRRLERARELAAQKGVTATQIALAYVLCQPFPTFALIGPRTIEEMRTSALALKVSLSAEDLGWLNLEDQG